MTYTVEETQASLAGLAAPLRALLEVEARQLERGKLRNLVTEVEQAGRMGGNGFFEISRGGLTSMLSVSLTYIIIIVQFKLSSPAE